MAALLAHRCRYGIFALPFILAGMATHDQSGRLMALANFMIGGGLALGPAIVAAGLGNPADYSVAPVIGLGGAAISLLLLLASMRAGSTAPAPPGS
jgi:DHA1 family inner membrane transport protein